MKTVTIIVATCFSALTMCGCAGFFIGSAAVATGTAVSTVSDRRPSGTVLNDEVFETRIGWEIDNALGSGFTKHITVTCYNGRVLLSGEIQNNEARTIAVETAARSTDVDEVIDQLWVGENSSVSQRLKDSSTATSVRARIIGNKESTLNQMKVAVDRNVVFLMGILTASEHRAALETASRTKNVDRVVSFVQIVSDGEAARLRNGVGSEQAPSDNSQEETSDESAFEVVSVPPTP